MSKSTDVVSKEIYARFMQMVKELKLTPSELARSTGTATSTVIQWTRDGQVPKASRLALFCLNHRLNAHWMLTGHGTPIATGNGRSDEDTGFRNGAAAVMAELRTLTTYVLTELDSRFAADKEKQLDAKALRAAATIRQVDATPPKKRRKA